jgi:hypothetical protein
LATRPARGALAFLALLLVNLVLFLRPAEIVPALEEKLLYEAAIVVCFALALPRLLKQLSPRAILSQPITACVLGLLVAGFLSHIVQGECGRACQAPGDTPRSSPPR